MKAFKSTLLVAIMALVAAGAFAQNDQKTPEAKKKVVIVKKSIDQDGNETVEKIVKEGENAENFEWNDADNGEMKVIIRRDGEMKEGEEKEVHVICEPKSHKRIIVVGDGEELPADLKEKMINIETDIQHDGDSRVIKIRKTGEDGEEKVFEWKGEGELPEDFRKQLDAEGIQLHEMKGGQKMHSMHMGNDNKAFLGVILKNTVEVENVNGVETRTESADFENGVPVGGIVPGSAAEAAGLKEGDAILSLDGKRLTSFDDLVAALKNKNPGDKVTITYVREGKTAETTATLKANEGKGKMIFLDKDVKTNIEMDGGHKMIFIEKEGEPGEHKEIRKKVIIIHKEGGEEKTKAATDAPASTPQFTAPENTLKFEALDIFPNPTDGMLQVQFKAAAKPTVVSVSDLSGKVLFRKEMDGFEGEFNEQINLNNAAAGTLLLTIRQGDQVFTEKVILKD